MALCEGWANYREWTQMKDFLRFDAFQLKAYDCKKNYRPRDFDLLFPRYYTRMFDELILLGCSYQNIEKAMTSKTFSGFRDNLKTLYPNAVTSDSITAKINRYEAHNF